MTPQEVLAHMDTGRVLISSVFLVLLPIELWRRRRQGRLDRRSLKEMLASASPLVPMILCGPFVLAFITALFFGASQWSPWHIPTHWATAVLALLLVDFCYYWAHRAQHRVRVFWAMSHSVHHSSWQYDQATAFRVSFMDGFLLPWFFVPVVLIGFDPLLVVACFGLIVGYQQWVHTEAVGRLGWFDAIFNTPSNHRVHHGVQPQYIDRNYGALLIVWDRCFGTYAREAEAPIYGLTQPLNSAHPWRVHAEETLRLSRDLMRTHQWRDGLALLWRPPGWTPGARAP